MADPVVAAPSTVGEGESHGASDPTARAHGTSAPNGALGARNSYHPSALHRPSGAMKSAEPSCPLCDRLANGEEFVGNVLAAAMWDSFPVNQGHALVIPRRHTADYFALTREEKEAIWHLVDGVGERINRDFHPQGFNIGINVGAAAGQTIFHVHMHVIPRYAGDVADPRGGVRWVIRARAPYWKDTTL